MRSDRRRCAPVEMLESRLLLSTATPITSVIKTIPATAGPWQDVAGGINSAFQYGIHDQTAPIVVSAADGFKFTAGSTLLVEYVSGLVNAGPGWPNGDARGDGGAAENAGKGSTGKILPSFYFNHADYPANLTELVGTFANNAGVIVGTPFKIGDSRAVTIPQGATRLQLGVNDDRFKDNRGSWQVQVSTVPTLAGISGTLGAQSQTSHDTGLDVTSSNVFAVARSSDSLVLSAIGLSSTASTVLQRINWTVLRNAADKVKAPNPTITENATNPLKASLTLNGIGSFNAIAYYDADGNGKFSFGEQLQVFHVAEVGVKVKVGGKIVASSAHFAATDGGTRTRIVSGDFKGSSFAITSVETVQVVGGGADGMIGVNKIHVGWIQNAIADSFAVKYKNGKTEIETLAGAATFPILDSTYPATGGRTIFGLPPTAQNPPPASPGPLRDPVTGVDSAGGQDRSVATADSPVVAFDDLFPGSTSPAISTDGSNVFKNYLSAYSDDYNQSYAAFMVVNWSARFKFIKKNGKWVNNGSKVGDTVQVFTAPTSLAALGAKTSGPLFNQVNTMVPGA